MKALSAVCSLFVWASFATSSAPVATQANTLPTGTLDKVEGVSVEGWSLDPDTPQVSVTVRFYVDAPYPQGELAGEVKTSLLREDVNQSMSVAGLHGFHWEIPARFYDGLVHELFAYGVDTSDPNQLGILFEAPKEFQIAARRLIEGLDESYAIGAWYFTAWSSYNDEQAVNSLGTFGRRDAWGGVRDHAEGADPWGLQLDYSHREPLIGFYDLADQSVMDTHIRQAASAGLSYFAFYWYWDPQNNQEATITRPLQTFLTSPYRQDLKFVLAPISYFDKPMTRAAWADHLVPYLISHYLGDPAYLTTSDGRPVVILFSTGFRTVDDDRFAVRTLRDQVQAALNREPFVLWLYNPDYSPEHTAYVASDYGVDGFICFHYAPSRPGEPYAEMLARWPAIMARLSGFFHVPCVSTGFDARPWYRITWGFDGAPTDSLIYNTDITLSAFSDHLIEAKAYLDARPSETSNTLIIYAWNEWAEGGNIEPSRVGGYEYLDVIQSTFGLTSRTARPPVELRREPTPTAIPPAPRTPTPDLPSQNPMCGTFVLGLLVAFGVRRKRHPSNALEK